MNSLRRCISFVLLVALAACASTAQPQTRKKIERADQLPPASYATGVAPSKIMQDDAAYKELSAWVRSQLEAYLREYDIADRSTLRSYYETLAMIAITEGRYDDGLALTGKVRGASDKPGQRVLGGAFPVPLQAIVAGNEAGREKGPAAFETKLRGLIASAPFSELRLELQGRRATIKTFAPDVLAAYIASAYDSAAAKTHSIPLDAATAVVHLGFACRELPPYRDTADAVFSDELARHASENSNIWAQREVSFDAGERRSPVNVAIWDSGVDPAVYPNLMWKPEKPGQDPYSAGWSLDGARVSGPLIKLDLNERELTECEHDLRGFSDLQEGIGSPEANAIRRKFLQMPKERFGRWNEGMSEYTHFIHGTHVAGIAAAGNPAVRLISVRMNFPWQTVPPPPTIESAKRLAQGLRDAVAFMKQNHVRAANMSWTIERLDEFENPLAANGIGTPESRRKQAMEMFAIVDRALSEAIKSAPEILFICSAGNANSDDRFRRYIPASYDFPNVLTVGAVDQAGNETTFTSGGKADVYANGFEVESYLPGGDRIKWSGTSMASPQVVNLAAKLLAKNPQLTTAELRSLILDATELRASGNRQLRLLNPKQSMALLTKKQAVSAAAAK